MQPQRFARKVYLVVLLAVGFAASTQAQLPPASRALTWAEVKQRFQADNPTLRAGAIGIDEAKANEITAYLRPKPTLTLLTDQIDPIPRGPAHGPFAFLWATASLSYLHERRHKRELRLESAKEATDITVSGQADLERTPILDLGQEPGADVGVLQGKAVLEITKSNLAYWDEVLRISRDRFEAGDLAQMDLDRLELQRAQFETDMQGAEVNQLQPLDDFRQTALDNRTDLKAAMQAVDKARTDHQLAVANGSTDPTFAADVGRNPPIDQCFGVGVSIPLRIFDRNQGEKLRTQLDIDRSQKLLDATKAGVFSDVHSAYTQVNSSLILLRPYKAQYLQQAVRVRETVRFAWEHGGSSLLDSLSAEQDFRFVQLSYANLLGSYLAAVAQLNAAVGQEVIQ